MPAFQTLSNTVEKSIHQARFIIFSSGSTDWPIKQLIELCLAESSPSSSWLMIAVFSLMLTCSERPVDLRHAAIEGGSHGVQLPGRQAVGQRKVECCSPGGGRFE